jgi:hypothetical protein
VADLRERELLRRLSSAGVSSAELSELAARPDARRLHTVRRAIAANPRTRRAEAIGLVPTLFWRDLAAISSDAWAHPEIRRAADKELLRRLPGLAISEKIEIAAIGGRGVIAAISAGAGPGVLRGLLRNPRLVEQDLVVLARATEDPQVLEMLADDSVWGLRRAVRGAIARNPSAPVDCALELLISVPTEDLEEIAADPRGSFPIRSGARAELARRLEGLAPVK